jgi:hypothetical protein
VNRVFCLLLLAVTTTVVAKGSESFYGCWKIDKLVGYSDISVSEADLHKLVGARVVIAADHIQIGSNTCVPDDMRVESRDVHKLLREGYEATPQDAGVSEETSVLSANPCGDFFRADDGAIVLYRDGGFYRASRVKP